MPLFDSEGMRGYGNSTPASAYLRPGYDPLRRFDSTTNLGEATDFPPKTGFGFVQTRQQPMGPAEMPTASTDNRWVTVFGLPTIYPSDTLMNVLNGFGTVVAVEESNGNYLHVMYSSLMEAKEALKRKFTLLYPGCMVGITKCTKFCGSDAPVIPVKSSSKSPVVIEKPREKSEFWNLLKYIF